MSAPTAPTATAAAATGDTWGISGPGFLALYALGFAAVLLVAVVMRRRILDPTDTPAAGPGPLASRRLRPPAMRQNHDRIAFGPLGPEELAVIDGQPRLAVTCAVTSLYDRGLLRPGRTRSGLTTTGEPLPPDATRLEQEVFNATVRAGELQLESLSAPVSRGPAVAACRDRLQGAGLVPTPAQAHACRQTLIPLLVLAAIGIIRAAVGASRGKPVDLLGVELIFTALALMVLAQRPTTNRRGKALLAAARRDNNGLRSGGVPGQRALALALFDTEVLWDADPVFASQLGLTRPSRDGGSGSDGGGGGCGGGSDGGGGGCGGGCGG
ncbi:TIGR04222 domain-containing membrane protein [Frankia sp. Cas4]|uniref:TIGR04222 domain-containing membrane protein n=1 Tax=Frankia sp. Cas4 TaxID=3073927 RepID=UPI002AD58E7F|nr:TIGR04222 domain-containing membrane protein [Frankia sp. Cas4]